MKISSFQFYEEIFTKHRGKSSISSGNLYQILTYVKSKEYELKDENHKVSGMLLYAGTDESTQPNERYMMDGNRISVRTLDLNKEFKDIENQLYEIASGFLEGKY